MQHERPLCRNKRPAYGFTLIELIIVMAIIALLGAITVPTLARMGLFARDDINDASRDLYGLMRSARTYATTHRVDTAVVYVLNIEEDSRDGTPHIVGDSVAMARRLKSQEENNLAPQLDALSAVGLEPVYVLVDGIEGRMWSLPGDARIFFDSNSRAGLMPVALCRLDGELLEIVEPRGQVQAYVDEDTTWEPMWEMFFPTFVFRPSGELRTTVQQPRLAATVGVTPTADVRHRFLDYEEEYPQQEVAPAYVVVNQFSGRVVIESDRFTVN